MSSICGYEWQINTEHNDSQGNLCEGTAYSPLDWFYRVENLEQANKLAQVLLADNTICAHGGLNHTGGCSDGAFCIIERRLRSQALATFFLKAQIPVPVSEEL